ncbi:unnamed protein product [Lymnaea stagnalis]|uniref:Radical SAM core domain-containing protein n=1 Tax=Lymnaea stagnalis TaxID=6523 RepID=A0AAV2H7S2_LYMST
MKLCLIKEAQTLLTLSGVQEITSVFFGGGTPSLAHPDTIKMFMEDIKSRVSVQPTAEISMEINPTSLELEKLKDFQDAGINRVSIGIQTLDRYGLNLLGRDHSVEESLRCLEMAKCLFPSSVSVDLIYGWPGQTLSSWLSELQEMLHLCDYHISLYQLTLERGTDLFKQIHQGHLSPVEQQVSEDMYLQAVELLNNNGFERYEVSNFAKQKCYSHHNISYWTGQAYIGVGPGAHGRFKPVNKDHREARIQTLEPNDWMWEVEKFGHATRKIKQLNPQNQLEELLSVGLRTKKGVSSREWSNVEPASCMKDVLFDDPKVQLFVQKGLLKFNDRGLCASDEGMNVLDSLLPDLLNAVEKDYFRKRTAV